LKLPREFKIGLLIVAATVGAVWGINFLKGKNIFTNATHYYVIYDNINGLLVSNPVKVYGFKIGKVEDIVYLPNRSSGHLLVKLRIENSEFKIPKDSKARIRSSDLLGSREVAIIMGNSSDFFKPGDTLNAQMEQTLSEQVNEMLAPLKVKVENLLGSVDSIIITFKEVFDEKGMSNITKGISGIRTTIENVTKITETLKNLVESEKGKISGITSNVESISGNLKSNNKKISGIINNLESVTDSVKNMRLGQLGRKLNSSLVHLDSLIIRLNSKDGTLGRLISSPALYHDLDSTVNSLNSLIQEIKNRPGEYITVSLFGKRLKKSSKTK